MPRIAAETRRTYSCTSSSPPFTHLSTKLATRSPVRGETGQAELSSAKRLEAVAQRGSALEIEVRSRRLHLALEPGDVGVELCLRAERLAFLAHRGGGHVVALVHARQHVIDRPHDRLGRDAVGLVVGGLQRAPP